MKIGVFIKDHNWEDDPRLFALEDELRKGSVEVYRFSRNREVQEGTDMVLSIGGDGTFLSASNRIGNRGIPLLGVNFGRMGFLSGSAPEEVAEPLLSGNYQIEEMPLLSVKGIDPDLIYPYPVNEVAVHRYGSSILGVSVKVDGNRLPEYWADGLLVATSAGSTAYSLSVGGPICMPDAKVLIIAPIASHNLNVRPLIIPQTATVEIEVTSRERNVMVMMDNLNALVDTSVHLTVSMAQFSLRKVRLPNSSFVKALTSKLFWGEDVRNVK